MVKLFWGIFLITYILLLTKLRGILSFSFTDKNGHKTSPNDEPGKDTCNVAIIKQPEEKWKRHWHARALLIRKFHVIRGNFYKSRERPVAWCNYIANRECASANIQLLTRDFYRPVAHLRFRAAHARYAP